ncbi:MAG: carboxypeptidase-like regulatory domain-containing protein, partial [Syntrophomonadaceae bacterium]
MRKERKFGSAAVAVGALALWMLAAAVTGQTSAGSVAGRVLEEGGKPVAGATVTARNLENGFRHSAVSEADGAFRI